jgi:hypothetical protein
MFVRYHDMINEIKECHDILAEAEDTAKSSVSVCAHDNEFVTMCKMELESLLGNDEEYGAIEELQEEIVSVILP